MLEYGNPFPQLCEPAVGPSEISWSQSEPVLQRNKRCSEHCVSRLSSGTECPPPVIRACAWRGRKTGASLCDVLPRERPVPEFLVQRLERGTVGGKDDAPPDSTILMIVTVVSKCCWLDLQVQNMFE